MLDIFSVVAQLAFYRVSDDVEGRRISPTPVPSQEASRRGGVVKPQVHKTCGASSPLCTQLSSRG